MAVYGPFTFLLPVFFFLGTFDSSRWVLTSEHYAYFLSSSKEKDVARGTPSCFEKVVKKLYMFWLISIKYSVPRLWLVRKGANKCRFYFRLSMFSQIRSVPLSEEM